VPSFREGLGPILLLAPLDSSRLPFVPCQDAAEVRFPDNLSLGSGNRFQFGTRLEGQNPVPDVPSLMRTSGMVILQPGALNVIQMVQAQTDEMIEVPFLGDTALAPGGYKSAPLALNCGSQD